MKKQILNYEIPEVEVVEINVEKGYQGSGSNEGFDGGGGDGGSDDEGL